jgi:beta-glucanase (GH16 family)
MNDVWRIATFSVLLCGACDGSSPTPKPPVETPDGGAPVHGGDGDGDGDEGDGDGDMPHPTPHDAGPDDDLGTEPSDAAPPQGYEAVWADEFENDGLPDEAKWNYNVEGPGWVNDELQNYTDHRSENVRIEDGVLIIEARRDDFDGEEYSSARINSAGKGDLTYGRVVVRARIPEGRGTWPAIWMMPTCSEATGWNGCSDWPNSGEIDIMEHVGYDPNVIHGTIHCEAYNFAAGTQKTAWTTIPSATRAFHEYQLVRTPQYIEIGIDGYVYFRYENDGSGHSTWPFDTPFHVILNLAVGGSWGGAEGVDPEAFPTRLEIDYVRMYAPVD